MKPFKGMLFFLLQKECRVGLLNLKMKAMIKNNEIMPFAAMWMGLESIILSEVSQTEKVKDRMTSLTRARYK